MLRDIMILRIWDVGHPARSAQTGPGPRRMTAHGMTKRIKPPVNRMYFLKI